MLLQCDVIEFRHVLFDFSLPHDLFDEILSVIPPPRLIDLSKVLDQEGTLTNSAMINADSSLSFGMDPEP